MPDSRGAGFATGAVAGAAAAAAGLLAWQAYARRVEPSARRPWSGVEANGALQPAVATAGADAKEARALSSSTLRSDPIIREQLTRNLQFFGQGGQGAICDALVVVVGLGGVGSHAAHMLLRAGVGRLRLIDFDQVTLSSLNRHATAARADVGLPKATALARAFASIMPEARLDPRVAMFTADAADDLLAGDVAYVVDAIDNIGTKVALLAACAARGLRVVCAAGAGAKADPTRVRLVDLAASKCDPLARAVRYKLRAAGGDPSGVVAVVSDEPPRCSLVWAGGEGGGADAGDEASAAAAAAADPEAFRPAPGFRVRTVPVSGPTPAAFGLAAAAMVLCDLAGAPFTPCPPPDPRASHAYRVLWDRLAEAEGAPPACDVDDVVVLVRSVWRVASARSAPAARLAGGAGPVHDLASLTLTRWDPARPSTPDNLVLLTRAEAEELGQAGGGPVLEAAVAAGTASPDDAAFVRRVRAGLAAAGVECGVRGWD